jgi:hypothetical protein
MVLKNAVVGRQDARAAARNLKNLRKVTFLAESTARKACATKAPPLTYKK